MYYSYLEFCMVVTLCCLSIKTNRFQVKKKQFFRNFMTIVLFGAVGTVISFIIISFGKHFHDPYRVIDSIYLLIVVLYVLVFIHKMTNYSLNYFTIV